MLAALLCASSVAFSPVALTSRSAVVQTRTEPVMLESAALGRRSAFPLAAGANCHKRLPSTAQLRISYCEADDKVKRS